jgi:hypothetical protein
MAIQVDQKVKLKIATKEWLVNRGVHESLNSAPFDEPKSGFEKVSPHRLKTFRSLFEVRCFS